MSTSQADRALQGDPTPRPRFVMPADDGWRDDAACADQDTELFFPSPGDHVTATTAVAICDTCPVSDACLRDALETGEQHGIRGGLTPQRRKQLRTDRRRGVHRPRREYAAKPRPRQAPATARQGNTTALETLWRRVISEVDLSGPRPTVRAVADQLGVSRSYAHRAIAAHRDAWDELADSPRHARTGAAVTL